jgi:DNA modification methylase
VADKKVFAPTTPIDSRGWYLFNQRDAEYRKTLFPEEAIKHPAKANLFMIQALVEYLTEPGDMLIEPFGGTGSIMVAALLGRQVTLIELEVTFQDLILKGIEKLETYAPGIGTQIMLIPGNCNAVMPIPDFADCCITSPPYAQALMSAGTDKFTRETLGTEISTYTQSPDNIGKLNNFYYNHKMEEVYRKLYATIKPGGSICIIIKDRISDGKRVGLVDWLIRCCVGIGWQFEENFKWFPQGTAYTAIHRSQGLETVDEEDLVIFRKPGNK